MTTMGKMQMEVYNRFYAGRERTSLTKNRTPRQLIKDAIFAPSYDDSYDDVKKIMSAVGFVNPLEISDQIKEHVAQFSYSGYSFEKALRLIRSVLPEDKSVSVRFSSNLEVDWSKLDYHSCQRMKYRITQLKKGFDFKSFSGLQDGLGVRVEKEGNLLFHPQEVFLRDKNDRKMHEIGFTALMMAVFRAAEFYPNLSLNPLRIWLDIESWQFYFSPCSRSFVEDKDGGWRDDALMISSWYLERGLYAYKKGEACESGYRNYFIQQALDDFNFALELNPKQLDAQFALENTLRLAGKEIVPSEIFSRFAALLREIDYDALDCQCLAALDALYAKEGRIDQSALSESLAYFTAMLEQDPRCVFALNNIGQIFFVTGSREESRHFFEEILKLCGRNPVDDGNNFFRAEALFFLAALDVINGKYSDAISKFETSKTVCLSEQLPKIEEQIRKVEILLASKSWSPQQAPS